MNPTMVSIVVPVFHNAKSLNDLLVAFQNLAAKNAANVFEFVFVFMFITLFFDFEYSTPHMRSDVIGVKIVENFFRPVKPSDFDGFREKTINVTLL